MARTPSITIVTAGDAGYFGLLTDLLTSLRRGLGERLYPLSILDVGLSEAQADSLRRTYGATVRDPGWDLNYPRRAHAREYLKAMTARPHLPKHFPGYDIYLWLDADCWVQDASVLDIFIHGAAAGNLAIVPEIDRSYWTIHKRPKLWGQNQKAFAWAYGLSEGYHYGHNVILNVGAFALRGDAPHWQLWSDNYARALHRTRLNPWAYKDKIECFLVDQTSLNRAVFVQNAPTTLLPAYCNWFCGKGTPMFDAEKHLVIEPYEPHQALGIVHLAGKGMKERVWTLKTLQGGTIATRLTYTGVQALPRATKNPFKIAARD